MELVEVACLYPNCLHATCASAILQPVKHTGFAVRMFSLGALYFISTIPVPLGALAFSFTSSMPDWVTSNSAEQKKEVADVVPACAR